MLDSNWRCAPSPVFVLGLCISESLERNTAQAEGRIIGHC